MRNISYVAVAALLMVTACKNSLGDIPSSAPLGVVTLGSGDTPSGNHKTRPSAYFVRAANVTIPNSHIINDACQQIPFPSTGQLASLAQIPAGPQVTIATTLDTVQLLPAAPDVNGYVFYQLPPNDSMRIIPGAPVHVTIPGQTNGFDPLDFSAVTAESLFVQPISARTDSTGALTISWNSQTPGTTSFVAQLEFNTSVGGSRPNSQIFCSFDDTGQAAVPSNLANLWRTGSAQRIHAYRWVTTTVAANTANHNAVVVISQYSTDSTTVLH